MPTIDYLSAARDLRRGGAAPVIATNRINHPQVAKQLVQSGCANTVSLARRFLADAAFVSKSAQSAAESINTCIACNQACLDQIFIGKVTSCLVNLRACYETLMPVTPCAAPKQIAVVGAGLAGMAFALQAAQRDHRVRLYEAGDAIGGHFNIARQIPSKSEFSETLRYFSHQLDADAVEARTRCRVTSEMPDDVDEVILATGI